MAHASFLLVVVACVLAQAACQPVALAISCGVSGWSASSLGLVRPSYCYWNIGISGDSWEFSAANVTLPTTIQLIEITSRRSSCGVMESFKFEFNLNPVPSSADVKFVRSDGGAADLDLDSCSFGGTCCTFLTANVQCTVCQKS